MSLRLLLVDDNLGFLEAARDLLEREGMTVVGVASTVDEALRRVDELHPDVVLVDIVLGEESGLELAERLRHRRREEPARVVLISTYARDDFAELIDASSAVGFVSKSELCAPVLHEILCGEDGASAESD